MTNQLVLVFLISINVLTFAVFGYDKWIAGGRVRRIPEKVLWLLCFFGGSLGGLVGMYTFRHKTRKLSFQMVMAGIFLLQLFLVGVWLYLRRMY